MEDKKRISAEIINQYTGLDTPSITDAMDRLGLTGGLLGIGSVVRGTKLCGQAFTVHYTSCGQVHGTVGDFLDDVEPGEVVVIDNGGRLHCTVWGDIMSFYASTKGIAGTVIDGVCRDVPTIEQLKYSIFTKGTHMVTGKDRVYVDGVNVPVSVSNVQVLPGDLMVADDSGAVVVPRSHVEAVLKVALEIAQKEEFIREEIRKGGSLKEARERSGYHHLQSREAGINKEGEERD